MEERNADYRAGMIAAQVLNSQRADTNAKVWESADFFPYLAKNADQAGEQSNEMTTEQSVRYLREGFSLFLAS